MARKPDLLERAKKDFKLATTAEARQRIREREDLMFQVPEKQWDDAARRQRMGDTVSGVPVPPRPVLSISKLEQPIQLILNQQRLAHLGVQTQPLSPDADDDVAEVIQGLYRSIERDSQAHLSRSWAFDRAVKAGRGFYRIGTKFCENEGHEFDQVITIDRILNQECVYLDPASVEPGYIDGEFGFIASWMSVKDFKRKFSKASITSNASVDEFSDRDVPAPEWVKGDGEDKAILVAEYFYKEHEEVKIVLLSDGTVVPADEAPVGAQVIDERTKDVVTVKWCKLTGFEVLEEMDWNGKYIPIVPVIGRELQTFDEERRFVGVIGPAKDAQRLYNYAVSSAVEMAALEPKAPWVGAEGFMEGHEAAWQQSNTRNFPALEYKLTTLGDKPAPPPQRAQIDVGRLGPSMALIQQADAFIQGTTATFDPSLGRTNQKEQSGRAIRALQEQADAGNSNYLQSLAEISMPIEAKIVLDLIPAIYDRPGRLIRTIDTEDDTETVMLNQPYVVEPKSKRLIPVEVAMEAGQPVLPLRPANLPPGQGAPEVKFFDLRKGVYSVAVSIGRAKQTLIQEAADEIGQILQAAPQLMPLIGPIYFKYRDFPGAQEIAEMLAKLRDKQFPGLTDDSTNGMSPEQQQAQMQQMGQQLQALQQQLQAAVQAIETDKAKQEAMIAKAQLDNATKERIAQGDQQTKIIVEAIKAELAKMDNKHDSAKVSFEAAEEREKQRFQAAHEVGLQIGQQASQVPAPLKEPLDVDT